MKKLVVFFLFLAVIALGVVFYFIAKRNSTHSLPVDQRIVEPIKKGLNVSSQPEIDHIIVITMENKEYDDIVGSSYAPFINSLRQNYTFLDNYFAVAHPSLPNYLAIIGGSTFGIMSDCTSCTVNAENLVDQLEQSHKSWKAYMESMPSPCFVGSASPYAQKHDPFIYFDDIRINQERCQKIVPFSRLSQDLKQPTTTANFLWISPNLCNDMHDCSVSTGDNWLAKTVPSILSSNGLQNSKTLLIITWDEGEGGGGNHIPTILTGNAVKTKHISHAQYTHYSLLHTIESVWGLPPLTKNVAESAVITDVFNR